MRQTWTAIKPFVGGGVYVNELGEDEGVDRVRAAYGVNYDRLQRIKAKYDPQNLFRLNANVAPKARKSPAGATAPHGRWRRRGRVPSRAA